MVTALILTFIQGFLVLWKVINILSMMIHELEEYPETLSSIKSLAILGVDRGDIIDTFSQFRNQYDKPYNYKIYAVDDKSGIMGKYRKIKRVQFVGVDFYNDLHLPEQVDFIYTEKFDLAYRPYDMVRSINTCLTDGGIFCFTAQSGISNEYNRTTSSLNEGLYNWTIPSLTYLLATNGFECVHFRKRGSLIDVFVYKKCEPLDNPTWYDIQERGLLTKSMSENVLKYGYLTDNDLVITWIDGHNSLVSAFLPKTHR